MFPTFPMFPIPSIPCSILPIQSALHVGIADPGRPTSHADASAFALESGEFQSVDAPTRRGGVANLAPLARGERKFARARRLGVSLRVAQRPRRRERREIPFLAPSSRRRAARFERVAEFSETRRADRLARRLRVIVPSPSPREPRRRVETRGDEDRRAELRGASPCRVGVRPSVEMRSPVRGVGGERS